MRIVLGMGTGQCGFEVLIEILQNQADVRITLEQPPILPWQREPTHPGIRERIARWKATASERIVGDVACFYLPYVEEAIQCEPDIRIICMKRPRKEVIAGYCRQLDAICKIPTNHWSETPPAGWYHDPLWTRSFPQFPSSDRKKAIGQYWDEYYRRADELARQFPSCILVIDPDELTETAGVQKILTFVGIPNDAQNLTVGRSQDPSVTPPKPLPPKPRDPMDPQKCVVLVPFNGMIHPECERGLKELERRGYPVWRTPGYAAIDLARCQLATDALLDGFEETLWIDSDIGFDPDDVTLLRLHMLPIVCGVYVKKGEKALTCEMIPSTQNIQFGETGGLVELLYAATGFLLIRREVYLGIQKHLKLPTCNELFGKPLLPFFMPMIRPHDDGHWYLGEDFAFSERARQSGFKIYADSSIRLWHIGWYRYGWEDAGIDRERFTSFNLSFGTDKKDATS